MASRTKADDDDDTLSLKSVRTNSLVSIVSAQLPWPKSSSTGKAWRKYSTDPAAANPAVPDSSNARLKGLGQIYRRFAERRSMHGPCYILTSRSFVSRLAWSLMFLLALGGVGYHLNNLARNYLEWPTRQQLSLGFATLPFPAVTVCNVNPIRLSRTGELSGDLRHFLQRVDPRVEESGTIVKECSSNNNSTTNGEEEEEEIKYTMKEEKNDDDDDESDDGLDDYPESLEGEGWTSAASCMMKEFRELFAAENSVSRRRAGHQIGDMLLSCSFAGRTCHASNFTVLTSSTFGNCYTLQYDKFMSRESGPKGGLELLFFLDSEEYIRGITPDDGIHVTIHPQRTVAFPVDEGLAVAAESHTFLSLKLLHIQRKGLPYGDCCDNADFMDNYQLNYSRKACHAFCEHGEIHRTCQCRDATQDDVNTLMNTTHYGPCRSEEETTCMARVRKQYQNGNIDCNCINPCQEDKYQKTLSATQWPDQQYAMEILVKLACRKISAEKCKKLKNKPSSELLKEFVRLNIFYEDLNYETMTEVPDFQLVQLVSKVGCVLGLCLGLSFISVMEVFSLTWTLFSHLCCCFCRPSNAVDISE